jgi:hypothetical protein
MKNVILFLIVLYTIFSAHNQWSGVDAALKKTIAALDTTNGVKSLTPAQFAKIPTSCLGTLPVGALLFYSFSQIPGFVLGQLVLPGLTWDAERSLSDPCYKEQIHRFCHEAPREHMVTVRSEVNLLGVKLKGAILSIHT